MSVELPENVKTWIAALRSGAYRQTRKSLRGDYGYCCLGVACEVSGLGSWGGFNFREHRQENKIPGDWSDIGLTTSVKRWLGLPSAEGRFRFADLKDIDRWNFREHSEDFLSLAELNDDYGWPFNQIAVFIEHEYEALANYPDFIGENNEH